MAERARDLPTPTLAEILAVDHEAVSQRGASDLLRAVLAAVERHPAETLDRHSEILDRILERETLAMGYPSLALLGESYRLTGGGHGLAVWALRQAIEPDPLPSYCHQINGESEPGTRTNLHRIALWRGTKVAAIAALRTALATIEGGRA